MADKLKPCPFCGGEVELKKNDFGFYVICPECMCSTQNYSTDDDAISTWNNRPSPWHTGTPTEEGWYLTKVKVRDCDGSYFFMYEAVWFDGEEWVNRRHQQPVFAWQKIEED